MKTWEWVAIGAAGVLAFIAWRTARAPMPAVAPGPVGHKVYANSILIDSGQGYSYSINPEQNPLAFDAAGNPILPPGARVQQRL